MKKIFAAALAAALALLGSVCGVAFDHQAMFVGMDADY